MPLDRYDRESLSHDPIHGYIAFTAAKDLAPGETAEQHLIDHPWVQRLRHIHQLQSAHWVFPSAEHTRFQHVLGSMHLAGRTIAHLYPSLKEVAPDAPSRGYVESLVRLAALLHDVGHGPYGHFFDDQYLKQFGVTHEDLGQRIITTELADLIRGLRRNPAAALEPNEVLDPAHVAFLIKRPSRRSASQLSSLNSPLADAPRWLTLLRALFSGLYTVDNMDFVLRDAYMTGYSARAFDLQRLLHYSFFTGRGLAVHAKGLPALVNFLEVRADLFRIVYFHRTVRALDLAMEEIFAPAMKLLFPGNPLDHLDAYRRLTEWSLAVDVDRWADSADPEMRRLGLAWRRLLGREVRWKMACERTIHFEPGQAEGATIFTEPDVVERRLRALLPPDLRGLPLRVDVAWHYPRPSVVSAGEGQNFLYHPASSAVTPLAEHELFAKLPASFSLCRVYVLDHSHDAALAQALTELTLGGADAPTNM